MNPKRALIVGTLVAFTTGMTAASTAPWRLEGSAVAAVIATMTETAVPAASVARARPAPSTSVRKTFDCTAACPPKRRRLGSGAILPRLEACRQPVAIIFRP